MRKTRKYLRKEMSKRGLKFIVFVQCLKLKNPEISRRSVSNFDQDVFDYALEDAFVKVANVKSVKNFRHDAQSKPQLQVDICSAPVTIVTHIHLIFLCRAPRPTFTA